MEKPGWKKCSFLRNQGESEHWSYVENDVEKCGVIHSVVDKQVFHSKSVDKVVSFPRISTVQKHSICG